MFHSNVTFAVALWAGYIGTLSSWANGNVPAMTEGQYHLWSDTLGLETSRFRMSQKNPTRWRTLTCSSLSMIVMSEGA